MARISQGDLDRNALIDDRGRTILHECVSIGSIRAVTVLLEREKADVNHRDRYGSTALHVATELRDGQMALALLERGADVSLKNKHGETAVHSAILDGDGALAQLLIEFGADVMSKDVHGIEALLKTTSMQLRARLQMCSTRKDIWFVSSSHEEDYSLCKRLVRAMEKDHGLSCWTDAVKPVGSTLRSKQPEASHCDSSSFGNESKGGAVTRAKMPEALRHKLKMAASASAPHIGEGDDKSSKVTVDQLLYSNVMCVVMSGFAATSPHCRSQMELARKAGIQIFVIWRGACLVSSFFSNTFCAAYVQNERFPLIPTLSLLFTVTQNVLNFHSIWSA